MGCVTSRDVEAPQVNTQPLPTSNDLLPQHRSIRRDLTLNSNSLERDGAEVVGHTKLRSFVGSLFGNNRDSSSPRNNDVGGKLSHVTLSRKGYSPFATRIKVNQDRSLAKKFGNVHLYAVMDGHGQYGHLVAEYVRYHLPVFLESELGVLRRWEKTRAKALKDGAALSEDFPHETAVMRGVVKKVCARLHEGLAASKIRTAYSGTTLTFTLRYWDKLYVASIGDSRVVVGRTNGPEEPVVPVVLSRDHKPDIPEERERIVRCGGRVDTLRGQPGEYLGPYRVWLADSDIPGLAMSRSLGDDVAHSVGVISEPDLALYRIENNDSVLVLATDGVWDFMSNAEVVGIVHQHLPDLKKCAHALVEKSYWRWRNGEHVVDDITVVLVNLQHSA